MMKAIYDMPILTATQMRRADAMTIAAGTTGEQLMQRAGEALADAIVRCAPDAGRVVMVLGCGNNGGDGLAAATVLRQKNAPVTVVPLFPLEQFRGDAAIHLKRAQQAGVKIRPATSEAQRELLEHWLNRAILVVDAIFGTGLSRPIKGWVAQAIACVNQGDRTVLSVDIASGLHADHGRIMGTAIQASYTLPIAAYKWGHFLAEGVCCTGHRLAPAMIGISLETLQQSMLQESKENRQGAKMAFVAGEYICRDILHARDDVGVCDGDVYKQSFGHVWVFGGSKGYTGAPQLAARGAFAAGSGLVSVTCPQDVYAVIASANLEVMVHADTEMGSLQESTVLQKANAIVAGPGWGVQQQLLLRQLLQCDVPLVLDADALNMLAGDKQLQQLLCDRQGITVLTPHPGEAARLLACSTADVQAERKKSLLALTQQYGCHVVLKGQHSLYATADGEVFLSPFGSPRLAVAGSGDVLAGMLAARLAMFAANSLADKIQQMAVLEALVWHGLAGEQDGWYLAGQLADEVARMRNKRRV